MNNKLSPIPPGEILLEEFMTPLGLSQNKLARDLDIPPGRVNDIVNGKRTITTDTALRLAVYFGTTPDFWLNLQQRYDLKIAAKSVLPEITKAVRPYAKSTTSKIKQAL